MNLSEEQKRRINENRQRALQKLANKHGVRNDSVASMTNCFSGGFYGKQVTASTGLPSPSNKSVGSDNGVTTYGMKAKIEQNRLKALELLERKKSPVNSRSNIGLNKNITPVSVTNLKFTSSNVTSVGTNVPYKSKIPVNTATNNAIQTPVRTVTSTGTRKNNDDAKPLFNSSLKPGAVIKGTCKLVSREKFEVVVPYHPGLVAICKTLKTRFYDNLRRIWTFQLEDHNNLIDSVRALHPHVVITPLPKAILKAFNKQLKGDYSHSSPPEADLSHVNKKLVDALLLFQREGVNFGVSKNGRILLADDMGLGKTIQSICLASYYQTDWPVLIVTPSSVRFDWAQQLLRWLPFISDSNISVATKVSDDCTSNTFNIISYDIMSRRADDLKSRAFGVVIMDECHMLKNVKTARTKAALPILKNARRAILLSGTPALSRPSELYVQISALCPNFMSFHEFGTRYCDGKQQPWGWDFSGASNLEELQLLLEETVMIRRVKKDVLKQLPPKIRQVIQLDPKSIKDTKSLQSSSVLMQSQKLKGNERRGVLLEYFHETGNAKLAAVRDYVRDVIEGGKKILLFAHHKEVLDSLEQLIHSMLGSNYIRIDGRTSSEQRKQSRDVFQTHEEVQVALLSITAANAGLDLSSAVTVIFAELFWNPGILVQAEDRAHRIGQEDSVTVQYLIAPGTADDFIWPLIQSKLEILGKAGLSKDDFSELNFVKLYKVQTQSTLEQFFKQSFIEENNHGNSDTFQTDNAELCDSFSAFESNLSQESDFDWMNEIDTEPHSKKPKH